MIEYFRWSRTIVPLFVHTETYDVGVVDHPERSEVRLSAKTLIEGSKINFRYRRLLAGMI